jgi:predicted nucleotide-binding protein
VAEAIRENLANDTDVIVWTEAFALGDSFIESLLQKVHTVDFAVLVMTPDDKTESRGRERLSPATMLCSQR